MRQLIAIIAAGLVGLFAHGAEAQQPSEESACVSVVIFPALGEALQSFFGYTTGDYITNNMTLTEQFFTAASGPKYVCPQPSGGRLFYGRRHRSGFERAAVYLDRDDRVQFVALRHHSCGPDGCSQRATITVFLSQDPTDAAALVTAILRLTEALPDAAFEVRRVEP